MHKTILTILGTALIAGADSPVRCCRRAPSHKDGGSRTGSGERPIPQFECRMAGQARATLLVALLRRLLGAGRSLDRLA